ncbi:hypothetical protein C8T65DRAFT_832880 [Cerioporus squamosus]|nr:hypothetical protein C8T65DRAFT_832880 [Cerioporus squamosus]
MAPNDLQPHDRYAKQLFALGYGYPVWDGDPEDSDDPKKEILVGSVAHARDGRLWTILNTTKPADHPLNQANSDPLPNDFKMLPENMATLQFNAITDMNVLHRNNVNSRKVSVELNGGSLDGLFSAGRTFDFSWQGQTAAILLLDTPAVKEVIVDKRHIVTYMRNNFEHWEVFINETLGLGIKPDDIWFITGTTKTTRWMSAALHGEARGGSASIQGGFASVAMSNFSVHFEQSSRGLRTTKYGPRRQPQSSSPSQAVLAPGDSTASSVALVRNQCVFVHYYRMKKRSWMAATAGPPRYLNLLRSLSLSRMTHSRRRKGHRSSRFSHQKAVDEEQPDDEEKFEEATPPTRHFDPVDALLDHILENSEAEIAVACDRDIIAMFKDQGIPDDLKAAIDALKPTIDVEDGVATVVVVDPSEETLAAK